MSTTVVFRSGNSLAVRLPKKFAMPVGPVEISDDGQHIILTKPTTTWPDLAKMFPINPDFQDWEVPADPEEKDSDTLRW